MNACIERLIACGYEYAEAVSLCLMLIKEGGDNNLLRYVAEAERDVARV